MRRRETRANHPGGATNSTDPNAAQPVRSRARRLPRAHLLRRMSGPVYRESCTPGSGVASDASAIERILPGSDEFAGLLASIAVGAKDRDLNDENPFEQVDALKRAGFGILATRPLLVMQRYDVTDLWRWLERIVAECEQESWVASVESLRRYFGWEYDGYKEV